MGVGAGLYMCDVVVKSSRSLSHLLMSSCTTSLPPASAKYCDEDGCVCICLSVRPHASKYMSKLRETFCTCYLCPWLCHPLCNVLRTTGFLDDVTVAHNGPYGPWPRGRMFVCLFSSSTLTRALLTF